jgi:tRNA(adenine34) deaminase
MCAGAVVLARVPRLLLGAWDPKAGAAGSMRDVVRDSRLNHRVEVIGGVRADECAELLQNFFAGHRGTDSASAGNVR